MLSAPGIAADKRSNRFAWPALLFLAFCPVIVVMKRFFPGHFSMRMILGSTWWLPTKNLIEDSIGQARNSVPSSRKKAWSSARSRARSHCCFAEKVARISFKGVRMKKQFNLIALTLLLAICFGCAAPARVTIGNETRMSGVTIEPVTKKVSGEPEFIFCAYCNERTLEYFVRHAPFKHISLSKPKSECDIGLNITWDSMGSGAVIAKSEDNGSTLMKAEAEGVWGPVFGVERLGPIVYNAFAPGTPLYRQITEKRKAEEASFREIADRYRRMPVKPSLPEEARKYKVQAERAVENKRFGEAADRYADALVAAPWWPEGHFNRALILGEMGHYGKAIKEMKKYLMLVPDAADARAAQDRIYEWEGLARR